MTAIDITGVTKRYGSETALEDLDLTVERGEIYGFLGPNGAGKSTTINVILDFVRPTAGEVRVFGHDVAEETLEVRERTGILPEGTATYDRLTGRKHVEFAIESKGADDDPDELLERVGIADAADKKAGGYSKGMTQRLMFATALAGEPDLLILDEPSTGLDPNGARQMREIIREENRRGATVFFSSHIMEQVEAVCDRVGILRDGHLVAEDTVESLREAVPDQTQLRVQLDRIPDDTTTALEAIESVDGVSEVSADGTTLVVACDNESKTSVLQTIEEHGVTVEDFKTDESSLEDLFVAYTEGDTVEVSP
ncbi:ABC transporter ATP-binding protein [Natronolimnohabitans sp. A-GB9]|uniref:ABC transporter ATP-binding protein n=1 Tax=Natronolimnohabitans sp. A-GB9 TaxID=3069757 RepID=UPI0027B7427D|nr:ABC transporter ATP-binding protein [Natronolimnohabitans sp. A-GB9]MDQ2050294.1 ABC transporter ATP-binding protein [Natronolimnohabitans sp. A-GB9]